MTMQRVELGLTDVSQASGGCCGGGACACGADEQASAASAEMKTIRVEGMTCGHCVTAVKDEVGQITGVEQVSVDLVAGGRSTVTIRSAAPLAQADIAAAIDEAGYTIAA